MKRDVIVDTIEIESPHNSMILTPISTFLKYWGHTYSSLGDIVDIHTHQLNFVSRDVRLELNVGQISSKWDNFETFQIRF